MMESLLTDWVCVKGRPQGTLSLRTGLCSRWRERTVTYLLSFCPHDVVRRFRAVTLSEIRGLGSTLGASPVPSKVATFTIFVGRFLRKQQSAPGDKSTASSDINFFKLSSGYIFK
jgi:hypothetical protein